MHKLNKNKIATTLQVAHELHRILLIIIHFRIKTLRFQLHICKENLKLYQLSCVIKEEITPMSQKSIFCS